MIGKSLKEGKVVVVINHERKAPKKVAVGTVHWLFGLDRSGSMSWDIDRAVEDLKKALAVIPSTDYISVVWFSGAGQCKTLIKGAKNEGGMEKLLDSLKSTVGLTCFSEAMVEFGTIIEDLKAICPNFNVTLLTDGCPVVSWSDAEEENRIFKALEMYKDDVLAFNTIGFGNYYNADLLRRISEKTLFGQMTHTSKITEFANIFTHNYQQMDNMVLESVELTAPDAEVIYLTGSAVQYFGHDVHLRVLDKDTNVFILYADKDFTFEYEGETYSTKKIKKAVSDADLQTAEYAIAYSLYYRGDRQTSLEVVARLARDKHLVDSQINAFTYDENSAYKAGLLAAVFDEKQRYLKGVCSVNYLPREDAFCVMDLLKFLCGQEYTKYLYASDYSRVGLKTVDKANYFKKADGVVATDLKELVLNKEKINVSIRSVIKGVVSLNPKQADRVGLPHEVDSYIYRNQTLIKDGFLNMEVVRVAVTDETMKALIALAAKNDGISYTVEGEFESEDGVKRSVIAIDMTQLPVINKMYAKKASNMEVLLADTLEVLKLEAEQKMANYLLKLVKEKSPELVKEGAFANYTDEQMQILQDHGIAKDMSYAGVDNEKAEKGEDYYMARRIVFDIKGAASLPSGADVIQKIETGKAQNLAGQYMADFYDTFMHFTGSVKEEMTYLEGKLKDIKSALFEKRFESCSMNIAIVLTNYWFAGADADAKGNVTYTKGEHTLVIKATKEPVYY